MTVRKISVADPCVLAEIDGGLYRFIYKSATLDGRWRGLKTFLESDVFRRLMDRGMVINHTPVRVDELFPWEEPGDRLAAYKIERIQHFSYRRGWTKAQAAEVVVAAIDINLLLLKEESPFLCTECFDWNFTFKHTSPVMVDTGAFSQDEGIIGLIPEVLKRTVARTGINLPPFNYDRPVSMDYLEELKAAILSQPINEESNIWDGYDKSPPPRYRSEIVPNTEEERALLARVIGMSPHSVLDVGCNAGTFSRLFAVNGIPVVAIDVAANCVNKNHRIAKELGLPITSLLIDCCITEVNEYPATGTPNIIDRQEQDGDWIDRLKCEMVFVSSVTHHLYKSGFDFAKQADLWGRLAPSTLMVEFIAQEDDAAKAMNLGAGYSRDSFMAPLKGKFEMMDCVKFPPHEHREWYLFKRRTN
jgi:hypothetical protein